jgi:hypothetical protein
MTSLHSVILVALMGLSPAFAQGESVAKVKAKAALSANAPMPVGRPTLPDSASDRARDVHRSMAFGQQGVARKAAKGQIADKAAAASQSSTRGAAVSAAKKANADARAAAAQAQGGQDKPKKPKTPGPK